jgi:hypothetical protein
MTEVLADPASVQKILGTSATQDQADKVRANGPWGVVARSDAAQLQLQIGRMRRRRSVNGRSREVSSAPTRPLSTSSEDAHDMADATITQRETTTKFYGYYGGKFGKAAPKPLRTQRWDIRKVYDWTRHCGACGEVHQVASDGQMLFCLGCRY